MLKYFLSVTLSLFLISLIFPNVTYMNLWTLAIAGLALMLAQNFIRPALHVLLLPITIITLGVFSGVANVIVLWMVTAVVPGFHIDPMNIAGWQLSYFFSLVFISFALGLVSGLVSFILSKII